MSGLGDIIKAVAPTIATALGGPLAGAAVSFLAGKMGLSDASQDRVQEALAGTDPAKLKEMEYQFQEFMVDATQKLQLAQLSVNAAEATSTNWFVAGWRPFVGWTCGLALLYVALAEPFIRFAAQVWWGYKGTFPVIDTTLTMQVLLGILGLATARTYEKKNNVEGNR